MHKHEQELPTLYTVKKAGEILCYSAGHVRRLIREGKLRAVRIGRAVRVSREALRELMRQ